MNIVKVLSYSLKHSQPDLSRIVLQAVRLLYKNRPSPSGVLTDDKYMKNTNVLTIYVFMSKCY